MSERPKDLAEFKNPPVAEVVLGLQFSTEKPIIAPHLGLYWQAIRKDFPKVREVPPLPPQSEDFQTPIYAQQHRVQFKLGAQPLLPRCWYIDSSDTKLIQVQQDRFLHNWRKTSGNTVYPRYEPIRDEFLKRWGEFNKFCQNNNLGAANSSLAELTYVNHVLKDSCWHNFSDAHKVFSFVKEVNDPLRNLDLEALNSIMCFSLPDKAGRLHIQVDPAIRASDKELMIRMNLTVCGPVAGMDTNGLEKWFNTARWWIVKSFEKLTTDEAHNSWQMET